MNFFDLSKYRCYGKRSRVTNQQRGGERDGMGVDDRRRQWQDPIVVKSTSKYLRRNLVTLAASGKARKILSEPAFSGGDAENSLPVVRRSFDCSKCNRNTSMRARKSEYMNHRVHIRMKKYGWEVSRRILPWLQIATKERIRELFAKSHSFVSVYLCEKIYIF